MMNNNVQEAIEWFRFSKVKFEREFEVVKNSKSDYRHDALVNTIKTFNLAITALQAYQPWIPVSERLPTEEGRYLVTFQERVIDVYWFSNGQFSIYGEKKTHLITHWKPLPEPPEVTE